MSFESKKVVLTRMLGDLAVAWERGYRAACKPSGEGNSRWLETSESQKVGAHRLRRRSSPICDGITCWLQSVVVLAVSEILSSSSAESSSSYSSGAADIQLAIQDVN
jgi:hypothetical protein